MKTREEVKERVDYLTQESWSQKEMSGRIIERIKPQYEDCNPEEMSITLAFPIEEWELNEVDTLMGGITTSMLDVAFGVLTYAYLEKEDPKTISLNVNYVSPGLLGDTVLVKAKCTHAGRKIIHMYGEAVSKKTKKTIATATTIFTGLEM